MSSSLTATGSSATNSGGSYDSGDSGYTDMSGGGGYGTGVSNTDPLVDIENVSVTHTGQHVHDLYLCLFGWLKLSGDFFRRAKFWGWNGRRQRIECFGRLRQLGQVKSGSNGSNSSDRSSGSSGSDGLRGGSSGSGDSGSGSSGGGGSGDGCDYTVDPCSCDIY